MSALHLRQETHYKISSDETGRASYKNGFIVNIGDENDLINRLLTLMGSIDLQDKMSKNNQQMMGLFNIESILSQWIQLIIKIVHYNKKKI